MPVLPLRLLDHLDLGERVLPRQDHFRAGATRLGELLGVVALVDLCSILTDDLRTRRGHELLERPERRRPVGTLPVDDRDLLAGELLRSDLSEVGADLLDRRQRGEAVAQTGRALDRRDVVQVELVVLLGPLPHRRDLVEADAAEQHEGVLVLALLRGLHRGAGVVVVVGVIAVHASPEDATVLVGVLPVDVEVTRTDVEGAAIGQRRVGADLDLVRSHPDHVVGAAVELSDRDSSIGREEDTHAVDDAVGAGPLELRLGRFDARVGRDRCAARRTAARRGRPDVRACRARGVAGGGRVR